MRPRAAFCVEGLLLALFTAPVVLFLLTWFHVSVGLPAAAGILVVLWKSLRRSPGEGTGLSLTSGEWALVLLAALAWVGLSGTGGVGFQNWDHEKHNAMMNDLILNAWPVRYESGGAVLVYYLPFYLFPALAGKALGWGTANFLLWLELLAFVVLILVWIVKRSGATGGRVLIPIAIFCIFSGHDWMGHLMIQGPPPLHRHLEGWSRFRYMSITTQLFWVPNSAIGAWAGAVLLLDALRREFLLQAVLGLLLVFFWSPYVLFGLLPLAFVALWGRIGRERFLRAEWKWAAALAPAAFIGLSYYSARSTSIQTSAVWMLYDDFLKFTFDYSLFIVLEVLWTLPIFWYSRHERILDEDSWRILLVVLATLCFIPIAMAPGVGDFIMKASMGPLFVVAVGLSKLSVRCLPYIKGRIDTGRKFRTVAITACVLLILASLTAVHEAARGIHHFSLLKQDFHEMNQVPLLTPDWVPKLYLGKDHCILKD